MQHILPLIELELNSVLLSTHLNTHGNVKGQTPPKYM
jgi:hypothetical protein